LAVLACGLTAGCGETTKTRAVSHPESDLVLAPRSVNVPRGWIGIQLSAADADEPGASVVAVVPDSPAQAAGITAGDRLLECDGQILETPADLVARIRTSKPGKLLQLKGQRAGSTTRFAVKVQPSPDENSVLERLFVGHAAPSLDGLVGIGEQPALRWAELQGRVVVLDFWAPWCGVCHVVADDLNHWQQEFGRQLHVIGIATGSVEDVSKFAPRLHMAYPVAADPNEVVARAFSASAVPMVFVVDRKGIVRAVHLGYSSARMSEMKQLVMQLVSEQ
jgi:thiol-disulfide isomerase/thioredoxin